MSVAPVPRPGNGWNIGNGVPGPKVWGTFVEVWGGIEGRAELPERSEFW